jgi:hypothetical protein
MKVMYKALDLRYIKYFVIGNLVKFSKMVLERNINCIMNSHLGQMHKLH